MDCLFCKIAKKEIPADIIYENADTLAFLDIHPKSPGHAMVIPKVHRENLIDLHPSDVGPLFLAVQEVAKKINKALKPSGFTIGINHGKVSGQVIDHIHVHIIPRFAGDQGGSIHSVVNNQPKESIKEMANRIKIKNKLTWK